MRAYRYPRFERAFARRDERRSVRCACRARHCINALSSAELSDARSNAGPLCNGSQVAQAAHEHRRDPGEQERTDLKARDVVHAAQARHQGDRAQDHADDSAEPTDPKQQFFHAMARPLMACPPPGSDDALRFVPRESRPSKGCEAPRRAVPLRRQRL